MIPFLFMRLYVESFMLRLGAIYILKGAKICHTDKGSEA
jgi:hypothetical protein